MDHLILVLVLFGLLLFTFLDEEISEAVGGGGSFGWWVMILATCVANVCHGVGMGGSSPVRPGSSVPLRSFWAVKEEAEDYGWSFVARPAISFQT